jgi:hypothetical protein
MTGSKSINRPDQKSVYRRGVEILPNNPCHASRFDAHHSGVFFFQQPRSPFLCIIPYKLRCKYRCNELLLSNNPCGAALSLLLLRAQLDFIKLIIKSLYEVICIMLIIAFAWLGYGVRPKLSAAAACSRSKYPFPEIPLQFPAVFLLTTPCALFFLRQSKFELRRFKSELRQSKLESSRFKSELRRFKSELRQSKLEMRQSKLESSRFKSASRHFKLELRRFKLETRRFRSAFRREQAVFFVNEA